MSKLLLAWGLPQACPHSLRGYTESALSSTGRKEAVAGIYVTAITL